VLHGLGGSSDVLDATGSIVRFVRIDLPGHGGSSRPRRLSVEACVHAVRRVADALDITPLSICGVGDVSRIAQQAAEQDGRLRLTTTALPWIEGELPNLAPDPSGAHLWRAWYWLRGLYLRRDQAPPNPVRLTRMLLALLHSQDAYREMRASLATSELRTTSVPGS